MRDAEVAGTAFRTHLSYTGIGVPPAAQFYVVSFSAIITVGGVAGGDLPARETVTHKPYPPGGERSSP
jgi:hypothetical protein